MMELQKKSFKIKNLQGNDALQSELNSWEAMPER
jgi:hypothetical protein